MEPPESISNAWNDPKHGCLSCATRLASHTRTGYPVLGCSLSGILQFSPKIFIFASLYPKFDPKTYTLDYKHKNAFNQQQTSDYNTNSSQNHHLVHFSPTPTIFSFFNQISQTTTSIQTLEVAINVTRNGGLNCDSF